MSRFSLYSSGYFFTFRLFRGDARAHKRGLYTCRLSCLFLFNESGDDPPFMRSVFTVQLVVVVCVCVLVSQGCVEKKNTFV